VQAFDATGARGGSLVQTPVTGSTYSVHDAVLRDSDGEVFVAGGLVSSSPATPIVLASIGSLAFDHGPTNLAEVSQGGADADSATVALVHDSKLMVVGTARNVVGASSGIDIIVMRFNDGLSFDSTFGNSGVFAFDVGQLVDSPNAALVTADDGILIEGRCGGVSPCWLKVLPNGSSLNLTFGTAGWTTVPTLDDFTAKQMVEEADGSVVVAGSLTISNGGTRSAPTLLRLSSSGVLDLNFGIYGFVVENSLTGAGIFTSVFLQPDGKIVAAGTSNNELFVTRYYP
jgi:hypothetical protein